MHAFALYRVHEQVYSTLFASLAQAAATQEQVLLGAPGTIIEHKRGPHVYFARQFMSPEGKRCEESLGGPDRDPDVQQRVQTMRQRMERSQGLIARIRELGRLGFQLADNKTCATVGVLYNHGLFAAGAVLVGSHAYAVLLNMLGIQAVAYRTEDVDIARGHPLALAGVPDDGLLGMLRQTGIAFVEVPGLHPAEPATSFTQMGPSRFHVDLLVPARTEDFAAVPVPELRAHATALPYLGYLLENTQMSVLLARHGAVPVRVPDAARFALHKLVVARMRPAAMHTKASKDLQQAATLLAMLAEQRPGDIEDACQALPSAARAKARGAGSFVKSLLQDAHPAAIEALQAGLGAKA